MKNNEEDFSPRQSLQLIQAMIETTKNSISDKSHYFLLWGWAVMIGCLLQYYLKVVANYQHHYYAWFITPAALALHAYFAMRDHKKERVVTFINEANRHLWTAVGFSFMVLAFLFSKTGWQNCYPFYILLYGIGTYVSGSLIKFKPLVYGGALSFVLSVITVYLSLDTQIIMLAASVLVSYIIPGYLLRQQYRKKQ